MNQEHHVAGFKERALTALPNLGKLLLRVARDPRVARRNKLVSAALAGYVLLPFDFIPDWLPGIGQLDDIVIVALALDSLLNHVDEEVLTEHWDGDEATLDAIRSLLATATTFVPESLKERLLGTGAEEDEEDEEF